MLVETDSARWTVPPQRALWIPPNHPHTIHALSATEMRTVYCQPDLIVQCRAFVRQAEVHAVVASTLIRELVLGLFDTQFDARTHHLMASLLLQTLRQTPNLQTYLPMPENEGLRRAVTPLLEQGQWRLPMHELASLAAMSERTFTRHFSAELGVSFREWRQRARILSSLDLLTSGRSIKTIAHTLQFDSAPAYIAAFRALLGSTPHAFRQEEQGLETGH